MDSEEDFYNSSGDDAAEDIAEYSSEDDDGGGDEELCSTPKKHYTVLKEETMKQLQENDITEVCSFLAVSRGIACTLLLRKRWSVSSVFEDWFADEDRVRDAAGISTNQKPNKHKAYCKICMEKVNTNRMSSAACGHLYCKDCLTNYVAVSISDGPQCLRLRCPEPGCAVVAGLDMVEAVAAADDKRRFYQYLHRSYVECSRNRKWCPRAGCDCAVEFDGDGGGEETYDVTCGCHHKFCWGCTEEQHRPLGCEAVSKWREKNTSEADNNTWILVNTKPCPKCDQKIEKDQGCNHMTCKCGHEFCWMCLGKFRDYAHVCNKFHRDEEEARGSRLEETRKALMRYAHYYERFAANHKSSEIARADLVQARNKHLPELSKVQDMPETELEFVVEAWDQIVECRRVLKWSYVFGYYLKPEEQREKMEFFDFLQGQAESALERLHHFTEKEMKKFLKPVLQGQPDSALEKLHRCIGKEKKKLLEPIQPSENFTDFRVELTDLTLVTKKYFENLIRALENDLVEVEGVGSK